MSKLLLDFKTNQSDYCVTGSVRNVLEYFGLKIDSSTLFLLGGGFKIIYEKKGSNIYFGSKFNPKIVEKYLDINFNVYENVNLSFFEVSLESRIPIIVELNTSSLEYHPVFKRYKGRKHYIVIYGIDRSIESFWISDSYILNGSEITKYSGPANILSILDGIRKENGKCYLIKVNSYRTPDNYEIKEILKCNLREYLLNDYNNEYSGGFSGVNRFCNELELLKNIEDKLLFEYCNELVYLLKLFGFMHSKLYLKEILRNIAFNENLIKLAESNYKNWNGFLLILIRLAIKKNKDIVNCIVDRFSNCVVYEKILYEKILCEL